jgi:transcriptional regulator with XRE-family HTH domain
MKKLARALSERLRSLRETGGLSQQELATRADLSMSLVAKMEQGKKADPRVSTVLALAGALGVRPGDLLNDLFPSHAGPAADAEGGAGPENGEVVEGEPGARKKAKKGKGKKKKAKRS